MVKKMKTLRKNEFVSICCFEDFIRSENEDITKKTFEMVAR